MKDKKVKKSYFRSVIFSYLCIISSVSRRKRKPEKRPIFDSIRKPTAPAGQKFGDDKPEERARPSLRKTKHKKKVDPGNSDADL